MRACGDHAALVHDDDAVGVLHGREAVTGWAPGGGVAGAAGGTPRWDAAGTGPKGETPRHRPGARGAAETPHPLQRDGEQKGKEKRRRGRGVTIGGLLVRSLMSV